MLGFGGPTCFEEVRPFILNVTRGRGVPQERIEAVIEQYRRIGGKSPFNELTRRQADALAEELRRQGAPARVYTGFLYWSPYISDALQTVADDGVSHVVACVMAPQRSEASFDRYQSAVGEALEEEVRAPIRVDFLPPWHTHKLFVEAVADRVTEKLSLIPPGKRADAQLIFTAHSVPVRMAEQSGYASQLQETAALVAGAVQHHKWCVAYQSRSGGPHEPWLEPDIGNAIAGAGAAGVRDVIVVPIGFVCDHVEILFDLDVQAAQLASREGVRMSRAATVGDHPAFIRMLAELVRAVMAAPSGTGK